MSLLHKYNPSVCDGHRCPCDCDHCEYADRAEEANRKEKEKSILIKGVTMPKSCLRGGCPMDGGSCDLWEDKHWKSSDEPYRKRHPKCPLIEVPPHGRLIDADVLVKAVSSFPYGYRGMVLSVIENAPTIIEEEK